jgi:hypothetical protein
MAAIAPLGLSSLSRQTLIRRARGSSGALEESVERRQIGGVLDILIQVCEDVLVGEHKLEVVPEGGTQLVHSLLVLLLLERSADVGADGLELGDELDDERR